MAVVPEHRRENLEPLLVTTGNPDSIVSKFPLLDSAITETLRLCALPGSVRVAGRDVEFPLDNGGSFRVSSVEMVMLDTRVHNMREDFYPEPRTFKADRFLPGKDDSTDIPKIMSWGGGPHVCKGKVFAHHVMMVWAVTFLQQYDFTTHDVLPEIDPGSWNVIADPAVDIAIDLTSQN
ncbi:cytochrome P450 [Mycena alexandri]|uniref:Cytochrome P450 n=1 Tax=Mycena alexandri TaxID=1745969 RepID=A0AAD6SSU3_9AGAR|nr:cytochrome P450 [Mycena alexandri]